MLHKHSVQTIATSIPQLQLAFVGRVIRNRVDDSYGPSWRVKSSGRALLRSVLGTQGSVTRVSAAQHNKQPSADVLQVPLKLCSVLMTASAMQKFTCILVLLQVLLSQAQNTEDAPNNSESWLQEVQQQVVP